MTPIFLTLDDVLQSHAEQIANYGGMSGVRDIGLLESALAQPESQFGGQYLHTDLFAMAAAYLYHIVLNHPFLDGNKRVGLEAALVFLEINGQTVIATDDELVDLTLRTAQSLMTKTEIADFFRSHASPL
ncbi:MAG: type II toxin-antitoxin system death-on-curing family toxin [Bryobacteraceae bacterium]|nr:type II toxin-antitoxin system death-on-curing family toxin [Bryobacteraceae bacterium]